MSRVIWIYSSAILPDYRQPWTDYRHSGQKQPCPLFTLLCGGDLPGLVVDLEEGDVLFVGDLADQGVVQLSVGGLGVVLIQGKHTDNWRTWDDTSA